MSSTDQQNVEYLTEDPVIPSQQYVCLSFIEPPKDLIEAREDFFMKEFLQKFMKDMYLDFCQKNGLDYNTVEQPSFTDHQINEMYTAFKENNLDRIQNSFNEKNNHQTSIRGLKIRGSYTTAEEAKARAQMLRRSDDAHNIFVGQVGFWLPFNPINLDNMEQDYINSELNSLIKEKKISDIKAKTHFQDRQRELLEKKMTESVIKTSSEQDSTQDVTTI